jgi:hypothetical protein
MRSLNLTGATSLIVALALAGTAACHRSECTRDESEPNTAPAAPPHEADATPPGSGPLELGGGAPIELSGHDAGPAAGRAPLVPPREPGANRMRLEGCLTDATEDADSRHPQVTKRGTPPVKVDVLGHGIIVTHALDHSCCLAAAVETTLEPGRVTLTERLSGTPCRCRCGSTIRTAVGLEPGSWEVVVVVETPGKSPQTDHRGQVVVR